MTPPARLGRLALLVAIALGVAACLGPRPAVTGQEVRDPVAPGAPHAVVVALTNRGRGEGQVAVTVVLRGPGGEIAAEADQQVELKSRETIRITIELRPSLPGPYTAEVEAKYPQ